MFFNRFLKLKPLLAKKSLFLFGARASGKSSLIRNDLKQETFVIDLLKGDTYLRLSAEPWLLESMVEALPPEKWVVIDEIQRIPDLLNEVHRLIEEKQRRFLLTGSSAKKLRQKGVNLLAGRAWEVRLCPLVYSEIPQFNLNRYLQYGGLPAVYLSEDPKEELHAYVNTYLKEEIQAEAFIRKIPAFSRFLQTAALTSRQMLNFSSVASDAGIPVSTIREYYQLLQDTLLGFLVSAWTQSKKRKAISTAKFYIFDCGVRHTLAGIENVDPKSNTFGDAFEHFIALELWAYSHYNRTHEELGYWRTLNGQKVDFVLGSSLAIEVKATNKVSRKHLSGLKALAEENAFKHHILISQDTLNRKEEGIDILHWETFLKRLWNGNYLPPNSAG